MAFGYKEYAADELSVIFGAQPIQGFADGSFVKVTQETEGFGDVVGVDGEVTRFHNTDERATIELTLMQSSESNLILSGMYQRDRSTPGGVSVTSVLIRDRNGTTVYKADKAWISKAPDAEFDRTPGPRTWTIRCAKLQRVDGGN